MFWKNQLVRYLVMNIRHIGLVVSNLNDSLKFWRDIIGFKIKKKKHERGKTIDNVLKIKNCKILTIKMVDKKKNMLELIKFNSSIKKKDRNIVITENKKNYLYLFAEKLKAEIIHHNNYIGGRYSVLSEVGMLPAELMGLKSQSFKQFNSLIKNKIFLNSLLTNVGSILYFNKKKKI